MLCNLLPAAGQFGESDATRLEHAELALTGNRVVGLAWNPVKGSFDLGHLQEVHRRIFQDVYAWAGQLRVGPATRMTKMGPNVVDFAPGDPSAPMVAYGYYPAGEPMVQYATGQLRQLGPLTAVAADTDDGELLSKLAEVWAELNVAHPFREGNTRTQIVFFTQFLASVGFTLDAAALSPEGSSRDTFIAARFHSQATGNSERLAHVLRQVVNRPAPTREQLLALHRRIVPRTPPGMQHRTAGPHRAQKKP